jgi:hypothetical protein
MDAAFHLENRNDDSTAKGMPFCLSVDAMVGKQKRQWFDRVPQYAAHDHGT